MIPIFLFITLLFTYTNAATISVENRCSYTVWAGALPGGGQRLDPGQTWPLNVPAGTASARIWPRTGCTFDGSGRGSCQTGDCNGLLQCQVSGVPPTTLAEYTLNGNQNTDFFDLSLIDGFNVPMEFSPTSGGCTRGPKCAANINSQCPSQLQVPGGCNNPCCGPSDTSRFFKSLCPDAYSYPTDDASSTFTCPGGTDYKVVFCPA